jgi:hypothetical protein
MKYEISSAIKKLIFGAFKKKIPSFTYFANWTKNCSNVVMCVTYAYGDERVAIKGIRVQGVGPALSKIKQLTCSMGQSRWGFAFMHQRLPLRIRFFIQKTISLTSCTLHFCIKTVYFSLLCRLKINHMQER